jgi:hypothetical protein
MFFEILRTKVLDYLNKIKWYLKIGDDYRKEKREYKKLIKRK